MPTTYMPAVHMPAAYMPLVSAQTTHETLGRMRGRLHSAHFSGIYVIAKKT